MRFQATQTETLFSPGGVPAFDELPPSDIPLSPYLDFSLPTIDGPQEYPVVGDKRKRKNPEKREEPENKEIYQAQEKIIIHSIHYVN